MLDDFSLDTLPFVTFENRKDIPSAPGIYFVLSSTDEVLYVGKTTHLNRRWRSIDHQLVPALTQMEGITIKWLEFKDIFGLTRIEYIMIRKFQPQFNGSTIKNFSNKNDATHFEEWYQSKKPLPKAEKEN